MQQIDKLSVFYQDSKVGSLALTRDNLCAFEYDATWLDCGFSLNPISLPLEKRVFLPKRDPLNGLFGVFWDSLPDGWGQLLVNRVLSEQHIAPDSLNLLTRLAIVGSAGMGALTYEPEYSFPLSPVYEDLDRLAKECEKLLSDKPSTDLDTLFQLGGSSGGARPKILTKIDGEDWIIKFPSSHDLPIIGEQEYEYALCAESCGIEIPRVNLFPFRLGSGYFGVKRFDRENARRIHMVSVAGMLETSHRTPNLDYLDLMKLTLRLTDSMGELKKLYRQMCFNVYAHNRDDHSKNFSFLYDDQSRCWKLSPAYDLTYSSSINGWHATTIAGNGKNPGKEELLEVAAQFDMSSEWARDVADEIEERTIPLKRFFA